MRMRMAASLAALMVALAGCGQGADDNVMAAQGEALNPAEVDAVLGPDTQPAGDDAAVNDVNAAADAEVAASTEPSGNANE